MVKLFNILCDENKISCDYIPENSDNAGKVTVDINSREVTNVEFFGSHIIISFHQGIEKPPF